MRGDIRPDAVRAAGSRAQQSQMGIGVPDADRADPAAPIGSMSWILNAVAYPTLFRATGHGWANAVARFGAVTASSMYSMPAALSIPIHALALVAAIPAALFMPSGGLSMIKARRVDGEIGGRCVLRTP